MNIRQPSREAYPGPEKLRRLKASRGVTQTELADRVGIGQGTISRYASGASVPSLGHFVLLRNHLKTLGVRITPEDFVGPQPSSREG